MIPIESARKIIDAAEELGATTVTFKVKPTKAKKKKRRKQQKSELLTVQDAAEKFNVSARVIYRLTQSEELPCTRIGTGRGTIRIRPADLERYLRQRQGKETLFG